MLCHIFVLCFCCVTITFGAPLIGDWTLKFLAQFGYLKPIALRPDARISNSEMKTMVKEAVTNFQMFYGLSQTGEMDEETGRAMQMPRCGVKDMPFGEPHTRRPRHTFLGNKWPKRNLTYRIHHYSQNPGSVLLPAAVDEEITLAFAAWANVTDLVFRQVSERADINISFLSGQHGDYPPFDGTGPVLAHAFPPPNGMVHFDDDERWTVRRSSGQNLFLVAVHELGHALGLGHSNVSGSIMQPMFTRGYEPDFRMHDDDINGVQYLYGHGTHHPPDLCLNSSFDAIFENSDGLIYVLKGKYYWKLGPDGFVNSYPLLISHRWPELPGDIDTAFSTFSGTTYFFKGTKYWVYTYTRLRPGFPKLIAEGWPGIPNDLNAATWVAGSVFYFFKDESSWEYDTSQPSGVIRSRPLIEWDNITGNLDDVMYMRSSYIYFFTEGIYYRFNCKTKLVDSGWPDQPGYPRNVSGWWFKCGSKGTDVSDQDTEIGG